MNRRNFFTKMLGGLAAVVMASPVAKALCAKRTSVQTGLGINFYDLQAVGHEAYRTRAIAQLETYRAMGAVEFGSEVYLWLPRDGGHYVCKYCGALSESFPPCEHLMHKKECPHSRPSEASKNVQWRAIKVTESVYGVPLPVIMGDRRA